MARKPFVLDSGRILLSEGEALKKMQFPNFVQNQLDSFQRFKKDGFQKIFDEINPVKDTLEKMWTMEFSGFRWGKANRTPQKALEIVGTYDAPLYANARLMNNKTGEIKEQELYLADVPMMLDDASFIINGIKRSIIYQVVRSEGVLFYPGDVYNLKRLYNAVLMPERGGWYDFEVNKNGVISVRLINKRPRVLVTEILRVLGYQTNEEIRAIFEDIDTGLIKFIDSTLSRDFTQTKDDAVISIYGKLRPGESVTLESAEKYIKSLFFSNRKFDLGRIGRRQLNKKLGVEYSLEPETCRLYTEDIILILKRLIGINNGVYPPDDVDHLSNRRLKGADEILIDQLRPSIRRIEKNIKDKMSMYGEDTKLTPSMLVGAKPMSASLMSFFGQSQLSSYLDQINIVTELENKRRVSASGPGGVLKERAPFSVREVHQSQYSRFCPVTTPESNSVGVVTHLASMAKVDEFGFLIAPYRKVNKVVDNKFDELVGRILNEDITINTKISFKAGTKITDKEAEVIATKYKDDGNGIKVVPFITEEVLYLTADEEDAVVLSMSTLNTDNEGNILDILVSAKHKGDFLMKNRDEIQFVDVSPTQQGSIGMGLIPFVANDDARRALMGSNHQRQAVPLLNPKAPLVGTGMEYVVGRQSPLNVFAEGKGVVKYVDSRKVVVTYDSKTLGEKEYLLSRFDRTHQNTCFDQRPLVFMGQEVMKGTPLVDGPTSENGELALGTNVRVALMFFDGCNFEDSAIISERLIKDDVLTSVHVKEYTTSLRNTELGLEELTRQIPYVKDEILNKLEDNGLVRVGTFVESGDILAGVVTPRGEVELTAEEKLLRAVFGDSASNVKDNSLRMPIGEQGIVTKTQIILPEENNSMEPDTVMQIRVWVTQTKKIGYGDKIAGRHGDKSTIAAIYPVEDMPYTADGKPVDIVLTPTFFKRMNMGQSIEIALGKFADSLGIKIAAPILEKPDITYIEDMMKKEGFSMDEKQDLFDGRTGEKYPRQVAVGMKYVLRLKHIADEKLHARSTGPYALVTQQPLGGKARGGGQRFGEMEVWALEAHGAAYALQEMLTIKSDDTRGRSEAYKAIIQGEKISGVYLPETFKVLTKYLNSLGLNLDLNYREVEEDDNE